VKDDLESLDHCLKSLRLSEPSSELRRRITSAASVAWRDAPIEVAWWIPTTRLGIAAAAAIIIVLVANYAGDQTAAGWQAASTIKVSEPTSDFDELADPTYGVFVRHITGGPRQIDTTAIQEYREQVRQMLDEQG
jgi:hypothetical protein